MVPSVGPKLATVNGGATGSSWMYRVSAPDRPYVVLPSRLNGCPKPRTRPLHTEVTVPNAPWVMSPVE